MVKKMCTNWWWICGKLNVSTWHTSLIFILFHIQGKNASINCRVTLILYWVK
jgi:hypothetical protein